MIKETYYKDKIRLKSLLGYPVQTSLFITEEIKLVRKEGIELKKEQMVFKRYTHVLMGTF